MSNSFYSDEENYDIPLASNYMKFEDGDNKFRIMGAFSEKTAIQGVVYWKTIDGQRRPVRVTKDKSVSSSELELNKFGEPDVPKFFWAFPVWNYQDKKLQILEITQKTILKVIKKFIDNPKWGDPREYDIIVSKGKNGDKTEYSVTVDPKEKISEEMMGAYINTPVQMAALFEGTDPFAGK